NSAVNDASYGEEKETNESFTQDSGLNLTRAQFQHLLSLLQPTPPSGSSSSVDNTQLKSVAKLSIGDYLDMSQQDELSIIANDATVKDMEGVVIAYVAYLLK
ncbi:unnamed protein product, partial [Sphenostylis stenocarpa]